MKVPVLVRHAWHRHRTALVFLAAGLFVFEWVITRVAPLPSQGGAIQGLLQMLPPALMEMFGDDIAANLNPSGALSFGYAHPFAIILFAVWAVRVPASCLAGEIGDGTMDLIASRAVPRASAVAAALMALASGLVVIAAAGWLGTAAGLAMRPVLGLSPWPFLAVSASAAVMFFAFGCIALLVSATRRAAGPAIGISSAVIALSFVVEFVAKVWQPVRWLRPASLFTYYHPRQISLSGLSPADLVPAAAVALLAAAGAFAIHARRDL